MNKTLVAVIVVIVLLVAGLVILKIGPFNRDAGSPQEIPENSYEVPQSGSAPVSSDSELESIDTGSNLDSDFQATDSDIQAL